MYIYVSVRIIIKSWLKSARHQPWKVNLTRQLGSNNSNSNSRVMCRLSRTRRRCSSSPHGASRSGQETPKKEGPYVCRPTATAAACSLQCACAALHSPRQLRFEKAPALHVQRRLSCCADASHAGGCMNLLSCHTFLPRECELNSSMYCSAIHSQV